MDRQKFRQTLAALAADGQLWSDFAALCQCGGRLAGSASEKAALDFVQMRAGQLGAGQLRMHPVAYAGWRCHEASLRLLDGDAELTCKALLGSQSTSHQGLTAEVIDLGRGTEQEFAAQAQDIAGRIVLVRHEYPFSAQHLHRRRKLGWAMEHGAAGFIIANPTPGAGPVSGSSGRAGQAGIPAVATDYESAALLAQHGERRKRVRLLLRGEDYSAATAIAVLDAGPAPDPAGVVCLSAHLDGHDLAESAMDNASGVAVALAVTRALAPLAAQCRRGLRLCLFSAEEWALAGSRQYLDQMPETERSRIALNINLDTVGGSGKLTALTSGFAGLERFVSEAAAEVELPVGNYPALMANSDHYNFARHGIPALRLVAGFNDARCDVRHILTRADTRDKVTATQLQAAAALTSALVWRALDADDAEAARWRAR